MHRRSARPQHPAKRARAARAGAAAAPLGEAALAAASPRLLVHPALWRSLALAPVHDPAAQPWCAFWQARLSLVTDPGRARQWLEAAHQSFVQAGDRLGRLVCAAAAVESYYFDETSLLPLADWVARLEQAVEAHQPGPSAALQALVMGCGPGLALHDLAHPLLGAWADDAATLLRHLPFGALRTRVASMLLVLHLLRGESARVAWVADALPGIVLEELPAADALMWLDSLARHARCVGEFSRGSAAVEAALPLAEAQGGPRLAYSLHALGAYLAMASHDADTASRHLAAMQVGMERAARPNGPGSAAEEAGEPPHRDTTHYWHLQAGLALLRGDMPRARELARFTLAQSQEMGGAQHIAVHRFSLGTLLALAGEHAAAVGLLDEVERAAREMGASLLAFSAGLMLSAALARQALPCGAEAAAAASMPALRRALAEGARHDHATCIGWWLPEWTAERLACAIARGIEPAFARRFAQRRQLPGPDPTLQAWPWPLRIHAHGRFEVWLNDEAFAADSGRGPQRPLALLRVLVAHGQAMPVQLLMDSLWPEAEPGQQRQSFDAALLRLRRLLRDDRLLHLAGGRLALDPRWVWSDVQAAEWQRSHAVPAHLAAPESLVHQVETVLALVRGPLLAGETQPWAVAARERHRRRFVSFIGQSADALADRAPELAARLYERALDADPMAESLYRRLIELHMAAGERAEAQRVWRLASALLGLGAAFGPSPATRALASRHGLIDPSDGAA